SLQSVLDEMQPLNYDKIIILPLFPQYASSSTGSAVEEALRIINKWWVIPHLKVIGQFWSHPAFIDSFVKRAMEYNLDDYEHILFSYHGLPERQVDKVHLDGRSCEYHKCREEINEDN